MCVFERERDKGLEDAERRRGPAVPLQQLQRGELVPRHRRLRDSPSRGSASVSGRLVLQRDEQTQLPRDPVLEPVHEAPHARAEVHVALVVVVIVVCVVVQIIVFVVENIVRSRGEDEGRREIGNLKEGMKLDQDRSRREYR